MATKINCDQVAWVMNALTRYAEQHRAAMTQFPAIAHHYADTAQVACVIELMEILGLQVEDSRAHHNVLSRLKSLIPQEKTDEANPVGANRG